MNERNNEFSSQWFVNDTFRRLHRQYFSSIFPIFSYMFIAIFRGLLFFVVIRRTNKFSSPIAVKDAQHVLVGGVFVFGIPIPAEVNRARLNMDTVKKHQRDYVILLLVIELRLSGAHGRHL